MGAEPCSTTCVVTGLPRSCRGRWSWSLWLSISWKTPSEAGCLIVRSSTRTASMSKAPCSVELPDGGVAERPITTLWLLVGWRCAPEPLSRGPCALVVATTTSMWPPAWHRDFARGRLASSPFLIWPMRPVRECQRDWSRHWPPGARARSRGQRLGPLSPGAGSFDVSLPRWRDHLRPRPRAPISAYCRAAVLALGARSTAPDPWRLWACQVLNESRRRISKVPGNEHYFNLGAFEELLDVIIANYNATPHPALGACLLFSSSGPSPARPLLSVPMSPSRTPRTCARSWFRWSCMATGPRV